MMQKSEKQKISSPWLVFHFGAGVLLVFVAIAILLTASRIDDLIPIIIFGLPGAWLVFRVPVCGVYIDSSGVVYKGLLVRSRAASWAEVRGVSKGVVGGELAPSYFPVIELDSEKTIELMVIAGYGVDNERIGDAIASLDRALQKYGAGT